MALTLMLFVCLLSGYTLGFPELRDPARLLRRQSCGATVSEISLTHKDDLLIAHNKKRQDENAGLGDLTWDDELARRAQELANSCVFEHGLTTKCSGGDIGQNLYAGAATSLSAASVVQSWYSEKSAYSRDDNSCSATCGHYTQVVWKNTKKVGCAVSDCGDKIFGSDNNYPTNWMVVCNYDPPGNYNGQKPY